MAETGMLPAAASGPAALPCWSRILVRLPNWVGDVVMATPALRALRRAYPRAHLAGALKRHLAPLLEGTELLDDLLVIGGGGGRRPLALARQACLLRAGRFDAALLLTNSFTSVVPVFLARIPRRLGYSGDLRRPLLTDWLAPDREAGRRRPMAMPLYYQRVLDLAGIPGAGLAYELPVREEDRQAAGARLRELGWDGRRPLLALNPGASFGSSKLWPLERFAAVARDLEARRGLQPVVLCGPRERELAASLAGHIGSDVLDTSSSVVDLGLLRGLLQLVELLVTTDTGPRHVAVAMQRPVVVVMGPTFPAWTACNLERTRVVRHEVPCGPCHKKTCPLDHACMTAVSVEEVVREAEALLS